MKPTTKYCLHCFFLGLLMITMSSCKKEFLEINPKGKLIAKNLIDYQRLLYNAPFVADYAAGANMDAQVALGDEIAAVEPHFRGVSYGFIPYDPLRMQRLFKWEDVVYQPEKDAHEMGLMKTIYLYNKVINEVKELKEGTEQDRKILIAQAKASRAWTNFLMINYYGLPYKESSAATDPGFPIITEADVTATSFTRATVKEVYDFILEDLTTAIPDLPAPLTNRFIMSGTAAEILLGKVYMFMGKFNEALPLLNAAINNVSNAAIPLQLYDYNVTFGAGGSFLPMGPFGPVYPNAVNNTENLYTKQFSNYWSFTNNEFVLTPQAFSLFRNSDLRLKFFSNIPYSASTPYPHGLMRRIGPISVLFGVMLPDLYLLRAESRARLNDLDGGKADVEALRMKRMPLEEAAVPDNIAADRITLVKFILEERIREFAVQGYRWFDMRRLSVDPDFSSTVGYTHTLYKEDGGTTTFTLRPERFALRFAQKLISQNPGMENNP